MPGCERVGDICCYVFEDRSRVCFVSNVFPEAMETQVVRIQLDRTFQFQSIPPLLPAYNKYMGGVDRLSQVILIVVTCMQINCVCFNVLNEKKKKWICESVNR